MAAIIQDEQTRSLFVPSTESFFDVVQGSFEIVFDVVLAQAFVVNLVWDDGKFVGSFSEKSP